MQTRFAVLALAASLLGTLASTLLSRPVTAQSNAGAGFTLPLATGTLAQGGQFSGSLTITRLSMRAGTLVADGIVGGTTYPVSVAASPTPDDVFTTPGGSSSTTTSLAISQSFREIPLTIADLDGGPCDALSMDLSPIFMDQLGSQLDLAPATFDLVTLPRANRPLGNLLCTIASLVEATPGGNQAGLLNELLPVVNRALAGSQR